jgi:hypothetical protein
MIELIQGLPDAVVGFEAVWEVNSADYKTTAAPRVARALERHCSADRGLPARHHATSRAQICHSS